MIARFNLKLILLTLLCVMGGAVSYGLAYYFFHSMFGFMAWEWGHPLTPRMANLITGTVLLLITFSGYRVWQRRGGFYGYHQSSLYFRLEGESVAEVATEYYVRRIAGAAYILGQVFLAGPLLFLRAATLMANFVPYDRGLEMRMRYALNILRRAHKWQPLSEYPELRTEILYLARMDLIDFSAHKGLPKIKAERVENASTEEA